MPTIRPISDLRNNANEISDFCRQTHEPVYITRNGSGDMVVLSMEEYERQQALIDLYGKLAVAEQEISAGAEGEDFLAAVSYTHLDVYKRQLPDDVLIGAELPVTVRGLAALDISGPFQLHHGCPDGVLSLQADAGQAGEGVVPILRQ